MGDMGARDRIGVMNYLPEGDFVSFFRAVCYRHGNLCALRQPFAVVSMSQERRRDGCGQRDFVAHFGISACDNRAAIRSHLCGTSIKCG